MQRVLLKFEGLEAVLGGARLRRATLELYQLESPQAQGALIGLFRLKQRWQPARGSWLFYDNDQKLPWSSGGATGEADIAAKAEATLALGGEKEAWRAFDVTSYVRDILTGKIQNNGLLLRVVNGEPNYHVRFYPAGDLEGRRDPALRPRLTLEIEEIK